MPGRRNVRRELAQHDAAQRFADCYAALRATVPDHDRALIGWSAILGYLTDPLMVRRLNGRPVSRRMVLRWRRLDGCPILRGTHNQRLSQAPLSTAHALTAWLLSQFAAGTVSGFRVMSAHSAESTGTRPTTRTDRIAA